MVDGIEVARANAPTGTPSWSAEAIDTHDDDDAVIFEPFDLTAFVDLFEASNVLAVLDEASSAPSPDA